MTEVHTTQDASEIPAERPRPQRARREIGRLVATRVARLQEARDRSSTVATLAHLRKNVGRAPGSDPMIWADTMDGVPGDPPGDEPTRQELAVHTAMTLYALHQQSRPAAMHRTGVGLGQAVALLDRARPGATDGSTSPVRRRFDAVVTATSLPELAHHLRGLVTQMKSADIGLDYGLLADDLDEAQQPPRVDSVRRRWARQYYQLDRDLAVETAETDKETA